jgi:hypothetical protein
MPAGASKHARRGRWRSGTAGVYLGIFSAYAVLVAGPSAALRNGAGLADAAAAQSGSMVQQQNGTGYSSMRAAPGYSGRRRLQSGAATCTGISGVGTSANQAACAAVTGGDLADNLACLAIVTAGGKNACAYVVGTGTGAGSCAVSGKTDRTIISLVPVEFSIR